MHARDTSTQNTTAMRCGWLERGLDGGVEWQEKTTFRHRLLAVPFKRRPVQELREQDVCSTECRFDFFKYCTLYLFMVQGFPIQSERRVELQHHRPQSCAGLHIIHSRAQARETCAHTGAMPELQGKPGMRVRMHRHVQAP